MNDTVYDNPRFNPNTRPDDRIVIYCVHGTGDRSAAFFRLVQNLLSKGLPEQIVSIHLVTFAHRFQGIGIDDFANQLISKIKTNQHNRVYLVGHSRGGLVNAYATEYLAEKEHIHVLGVITVCAPFGGTWLATTPWSFFSQSVRQMTVGSIFLAALAKMVSHSKVKYYFFVAGQDSVVDKDHSYIMDYITKHPDALVILDKHGHLSILGSYQLANKIWQYLIVFCQKSVTELDDAEENRYEEEYSLAVANSNLRAKL